MATISSRLLRSESCWWRSVGVVEQILAAEPLAEPLEEGVGQAGDDEVAVVGLEGLIGHEVGVAVTELAGSRARC